MAPEALIVGFGRMGLEVARGLAAQGRDYVALVHNPGWVRTWRRWGLPVHFGDATRGEVLQRLGVREAKVGIVCVDQPEAARQIVAAMRRHNPGLTIAVRARDERHGGELRALGAAAAVTELHGPSRELTELALRLMRDDRPTEPA